MLKYKKPTDDFGYNQYIDNNGLSPKYVRAREFHLQLSKINSIIKMDLDDAGVKLTRSPTAIISSSFYDNLDEILEFTIKDWEHVSYQFKEELLIRSGSYTKPVEYSMPSRQIPITDLKHTSENLRRVIEEIGTPDQISLHPRWTTERLKAEMIVARFNSTAKGLYVEFGWRNIDHITKMELADFQANIDFGGNFRIKYTKGKHSSNMDSVLEKLAFAGKLFEPLAE